MDMPTGGDVAGQKCRLNKDSTKTLNLLCGVCTTENKKTEAVKYCITCEDYYCTECVKIHEKVPALYRHVIVGKSDFTHSGCSNELPSIPTERCATHPAKILDMYCKTHDRVGCATCMATTHGESCTKLYIPENIDILFDTEKNKRNEQQLRTAMQNVEAALSLRERCLADVLKAVDDAEQQLEIYTGQLMKTLTELNQKTRGRLDSIRRELESDLSKQSSALNKELVAAKDVLQKTTQANSESNNKSQQITCSNLAAITSEQCENVNRSLDCPDIGKILFRPHVACKELFTVFLKCNSLGDFSRLPSHEHKIVERVEINVKIKRDKVDCFIPGSCTLKDGTILLTDKNNNCIKRLSPGATSVSDCLQLPGGPWSLAVINQKLAVVTLTELKRVQLIALDKPMKTKRTFKLDSECHGIEHNNNELFISDNDTVYVYTVAGKFLRKFSHDNTGQSLFNNIRNIAMSANGLILFVADFSEGLIAVERESGRQLWCYTGADLKGASGVCVDGMDGVFVCGCYSDNILRFSDSGEKIGEVVTQADGINWPWSISLVTDTSTLVVTQWSNNAVMQYHLTMK